MSKVRSTNVSAHTSDYLIIGNSAAGVTAAEHIRACDHDATVLIVSNEPYPAYGRPLISYLLEGKTTEDQISLKDEDFYTNNRFDTLLGSEYEVIQIKPGDHQAILANEDRVTYKKCLLATGSIPFVPPIDGINDHDNVFPFITLDQAKSAAEATKKATETAHKDARKSRVIVVGGGLIGLKAAEALSYHADEVLVLELAPHILPAVLDSEGASLLADHLSERSITCLSGVSAEKFTGDGSSITQAHLTNGELVDCDVVIAAVGVRPNSELAVQAGAEQGKGLLVGPDLQTSLADIYAAGDVVQVTDLLDGAKRPLALWPNAVRQGKCAGLHMANSPDAEEFIGNFAINAVDFFDDSLLTAGVINPAEEDGYEIVVKADDDTYAKFVTKNDLLYGYILLNRPDNAGIYTAIIEQKIPLSSLEQGLFDDAPLNLNFPQKVRWERLHNSYPCTLDGLGRKEPA